TAAKYGLLTVAPRRRRAGGSLCRQPGGHVSHGKTIPLPGSAGRLGGRGGYHRPAGLVEEVSKPHALAALPAPARRETPVTRPPAPGAREPPARRPRLAARFPKPPAAQIP